MQVGPGPILSLPPARLLQVDAQNPALRPCAGTYLILHKLAAVIQLHDFLPRGRVPGSQCQAAQRIQA